MRAVLSRLVPLFPAGVLLLFSEWSGTLWSGAQAIPSSLGWLTAGGLCLIARHRARDLFDLGGRAAWMPLIFGLLVVASLATSSVARAGMTGVLVLPLLLALPAAITACWRDERERSLGVAAIAGVLALVSLHAAIAHLRMGTERAALPLGQHNLLAVWLVLLLPVVLVPALEPGWRRPLALGAAAMALVVLGLTGSLAGVVGWLVEVVVLVVALRRTVGAERPSATRWVLPALLLVGVAGLASMTPRLLAILGGADSSMLARVGYLRAAVRGFIERPVLGWGPGSSAWLLSEHLRPVPGIHPPYEVVTDAHSLWFDLLFELGVAGAGALLVLVALFVARRLGELRRLPAGPAAVRRWASVASILGGGICLLGAGAFDVAALAVAAAIPLALGLQSAEARPSTAAASPRWFVWLVVACLVALLPSRIAHWHFDRFVAVGGEVRVASREAAAEAASGGDAAVPPVVDRGAARASAGSRHLARAVRLDPAFPLYRFRQALEAGSAGATDGLRSSALAARGIGIFWLLTGARAGQAGEPGHRADLERACDLDPLGALAPFVLAVLAPGEADAAERLARALLAEPRLAAAARLEDIEELVEDALVVIEQLDRVPLGWRAAMVDEIRAALAIPLGETREAIDLTLELDSLGSTSLSLYAFRRRPTRLPVLSVQLARERAIRITAPGALALPETGAEVLAPGCRLAS
ncbi:MAG TPA: O-antigen ligase family protein [Thermoanaerobaculia bacterium]|nr:O-antigen ligase family protein [Thermoanaerobaculia bacterium]